MGQWVTGSIATGSGHGSIILIRFQLWFTVLLVHLILCISPHQSHDHLSAAEVRRRESVEQRSCTHVVTVGVKGLKTHMDLEGVQRQHRPTGHVPYDTRSVRRWFVVPASQHPRVSPDLRRSSQREVVDHTTTLATERHSRLVQCPAAQNARHPTLITDYTVSRKTSKIILLVFRATVYWSPR